MAGVITIALVTLAIVSMWAGLRWSVLSRTRRICAEHGHHWSRVESGYECDVCGRQAGRNA